MIEEKRYCKIIPDAGGGVILADDQTMSEILEALQRAAEDRAVKRLVESAAHALEGDSNDDV